MWTHRRSGQLAPPRPQDHRDGYERDRTRVIHCPAFRRLQRKTQILGPAEGDFHRTRLTHSLEVASIGMSISRNLANTPEANGLAGLLPPDDLISAICLLHDIGHPPFGHSGEVALHYLMRHAGGFEGNGQTLRLLTKVDESYGQFGLDLTRRTLLGVLKYPVPFSALLARNWPNGPQHSAEDLRWQDWLPPKGYFDAEQAEVDWLLAPVSASDRQLFQSLAEAPGAATHGRAAYCSFDCSIMNIADDIAYGVHDLEDAIHLQLITREVWDTPLWRALLSETGLLATALIDNLFAETISARKQAIGELVNYLITSVEIKRVDAPFENQLLAYKAVLSPAASQLLAHCITTIYQHVIDSPRTRVFAQQGQRVIVELFAALRANPSDLLTETNRQLIEQAPSEAEAMRVVCDYIACMTDEYAHRLHERLFGSRVRDA